MNMNRIVPQIVLLPIVFIFLMVSPASAQDKPEWSFSVLVSVSDSMVTHFGGLDSVRALMNQQFEAVNFHYNDPDVFDGTFNFHVDWLRTYDISPRSQVNKPHPGFDYHAVFDLSERDDGSFLHPPKNAVMVLMENTPGDPAPFTFLGERVLTHELAHARGAIDLYGIDILEYYNPVNEQSYFGEPSIMAYHILGDWDLFSIGLINRAGDRVLDSADYALHEYFPRLMQLQITDSLGNPASYARLDIFAHKWYDYAVDSIPIVSSYADRSGRWTLDSDIFTCRWNRYNNCKVHRIGISSLVVRAALDDDTTYAWLPFTEPQTHFFEHPGKVFVKNIVMPKPFLNEEGQFVYPDPFVIGQNYPNPFSNETNVCLSQMIDAHVRLEVIDVLGRTVAVVHDAPLSQGTNCFSWNSGDHASGVYLLRATVGQTVLATKMLLLK